MRIDRNEKIVGVPILQVRNELRRIGHHSFDPPILQHRLDLTPRQGALLLGALLKRGFIERDMDFNRKRERFYQLTTLGHAFTIAKAMKPIDRTRIEALLAGCIERATQINARPELTHAVAQIHVFGSYLDKEAKDFGDLDLAIHLVRRERPGISFFDYNMQRADEVGPDNLDFFGRLIFGEQEVYKLLKARSPYISIHTPEDLHLAKSKPKLVFRDKTYYAVALQEAKAAKAAKAKRSRTK